MDGKKIHLSKNGSWPVKEIFFIHRIYTMNKKYP